MVAGLKKKKSCFFLCVCVGFFCVCVCIFFFFWGGGVAFGSALGCLFAFLFFGECFYFLLCEQLPKGIILPTNCKSTQRARSNSSGRVGHSGAPRSSSFPLLAPFHYLPYICLFPCFLGAGGSVQPF